jgi:excisionase family DNA binding protein
LGCANELKAVQLPKNSEHKISLFEYSEIISRDACRQHFPLSGALPAKARAYSREKLDRIRQAIFFVPNRLSGRAAKIVSERNNSSVSRSRAMTPRPAIRREPLLTVKEAAKRCHLSERQIRRHIQTQTLKVVRIGRAVRVRPEDLENFINVF